MRKRPAPTRRQREIIAQAGRALRCSRHPADTVVVVSEEAFAALRDWASWKCSHGIDPWPVSNPDREHRNPRFHRAIVRSDSSLSGGDIVLTQVDRDMNERLWTATSGPPALPLPV